MNETPFPGYDTTALTLWREARGQQAIGMNAVANVIAQRALNKQTSLDYQCLVPEQFTSMTVKSDPEYNLLPKAEDSSWIVAKQLALKAKANALPNIVGNATLYYNPQAIETNKTIKLPDNRVIPVPSTWNTNKMHFTVQIKDHYFFTES